MQNESADKSPGNARRRHVQEYVRWSDIEIWVGRIGRSSVRLEFAVKKPGGDLAAEGYLVIVSIDRKNGWSVDVPKPLLDALAPYTPSPRPSPARGEGDENKEPNAE